MGLRQSLMRIGNTLNVRRYRRSEGRRGGRIRGMPVLLLTVAGRRTGAPHTNPVVYFEDDGRYVVCGSGGGQRDEPQWFRNVRVAPTASIDIGARQIPVTVQVAEGDEYKRLWQRLTSIGPFFEGYQRKTERVIPLAVLTPTA